MVLSLQVYNQFFSFHLICEFNAPCIYVLTYQSSIITLTKNQDSGAGGESWGNIKNSHTLISDDQTPSMHVATNSNQVLQILKDTCVSGLSSLMASQWSKASK
jgi:hypothetical protein